MSETPNSRSQEALWEHMNQMMQLTDALTQKTAYVTLGPADGRLYMQLCDTIASYAKSFERNFDARPPNNGDEDPGEGPADDAEPPGDQSPSPG